MAKHKFIFICGLHRSGTTLVHRILKNHPYISGLNDNGNIRDEEGQHHQTVYPCDEYFGILKNYGALFGKYRIPVGVGRFAFDKNAHLTETSALATKENGEKLFQDWSKHWDLAKPFLIEKSPPNIIMARFLQKIFPNSYFIVITRHPIATSLASKKWKIFETLPTLIRHWLEAHKIYNEDKSHIKNVLEFRYEDFVCSPKEHLERIYKFLNIPYVEPKDIQIIRKINNKYYKTWNSLRYSLFKSYIIRKYEKEINKFNYSFYDLL